MRIFLSLVIGLFSAACAFIRSRYYRTHISVYEEFNPVAALLGEITGALILGVWIFSMAYVFIGWASSQRYEKKMKPAANDIEDIRTTKFIEKIQSKINARNRH